MDKNKEHLLITDPVTGVSFGFSKAEVSETNKASRTLFKPTQIIDPTAKYAVVSIKDSIGNIVVSQKKLDIYEINSSYITGIVVLGIGTYQVTEFFILDANGEVIYIVPTGDATNDLKKLVSTVLPTSFIVAKDQTNSVSLQVLSSNTNTAKDFGYPSIAFNIVKYIKLMLTVQILDYTNGWLLTTASLKANNVDYNIPAETATLLIAEAANYNLGFSKVGYGSMTITLSSNEIKGYETSPLKVVLDKSKNTFVAKLPKTGQTKCYSDTGTEISCSGTGQDGESQKGVASPSPRFTVDTTGYCVTDNLTGLMWSKDANMWGVLTWQSALDKVKLLNQQGGLCGYTDWKLPNKKELESLVDAQNSNPALPTGHPFSNVVSLYYWSSTTYASTPPSAWVVHMLYGSMATIFSTTNYYYVWPVRSGQ